MNNPIIKKLLKEYDQKRLQAEMDLEEKLTAFYHANPELANLNEQIQQASIALSKAILYNTPTEELQFRLQNLKSKKEALLHQLNITNDFFQPAYSCTLCKDTGYFIDNPQVMCSCLKQKIMDIQYNHSNISSLDNQNFQTFSLDIFSDTVNKSQYNSELSPRKNMEKIKIIAEKFIENFDLKEEKNLLFTGNTGLGKTFLTNCIAHELLKKGKTVLYQTAPVMLDSIIDYKFGKNCTFEYHDLLDADLLIIDDLGTENINNLKLSELFNIMNTRLLNQNHHITKTIISTNLSLNHLFKTYDERIFSRLVGYYYICRFYGEDLRYSKKSGFAYCTH